MFFTRSQIHIGAAGEGYDPCRGIMHHDRDDTQAFVYDLIEPRRPIADGAVLDFVLKTPFTGADFVMRSDGVCRLAPQLARQVAALGINAHSKERSPSLMLLPDARSE